MKKCSFLNVTNPETYVSYRLVSLVLILREWAHKSLLEEEQRPDSFLERFRGTEIRAAPSRNSQANDADGKWSILYADTIYCLHNACMRLPFLGIVSQQKSNHASSFY